jgi:hypothetical protein
MENIKVAYFYEKGQEYGRAGSPLKVLDFHDVLFNSPGLKNLDPMHEKHMVGSIWFHSNDKLGVDYKPVSEGLVGCDIDKISKEDCKKILDSFDRLALVFPCIVSCWYSHSYHNTDKPYGGLHFALMTDKSKLVHNDDERVNTEGFNSYKSENIVYSAALAYYIFKECGVDIRPYHRDDLKSDAGLDSAMLSIVQQCFLNYSEEVKWNDHMFRVRINEKDVSKLKEWFDEEYHPKRKRWFPKVDEYDITKCEVKNFDIKTWNGNTINLGHKQRIVIQNFLASLNWSEYQIVEFMMQICGPDDYAKGEVALRKAIRQTTGVAIKRYSNGRCKGEYIEVAKELLSRIGIDVELEIDKEYKPLDYKIDPLFEEVWESLREKPFNNIYYSNKNHFRIKLEKGEHLSDHMGELYPVIMNHKVTCIFGDCAIGKTHMSLGFNTDEQLQIFADVFTQITKVSIDICEPFNSVADSKASATNEYKSEIKRVNTACLKDFDHNKKNVFIWDTIKPLYEAYFQKTLMKRGVLFLDESHKLVTDQYRWPTVIEMMKHIPIMYERLVCMTGTSAWEWEYLKQFYHEDEIAMVLVEKEPEFEKTCDILVYDKFGRADRQEILERYLDKGMLPEIYSNRQNKEWKEIFMELNSDRFKAGEKTLNILDYCRDNKENLKEINETGSLDDYDAVIATAYCGVGVDFLPSKVDERLRCSIVDVAGEIDGCTSHEVWQFGGRNRKQAFHIVLPVREDTLRYKVSRAEIDDEFLLKLAESDVKEIPEDLTDEQNAMNKWLNEVVRNNAFKSLIKDKVFEDKRNIKLLALYYKYIRLFSNVRMIRHYLERRGVNVNVIPCQHIGYISDENVSKEIYQFFVKNYDVICDIHNGKQKFESIVAQTDINTNEVEKIEGHKVYTRNPGLMRWLIRMFADDYRWKPILEKEEYMSRHQFEDLFLMMSIAKRITKEDLNKLKKIAGVGCEEALDAIIQSLMGKHFAGIFDSMPKRWNVKRYRDDMFDKYKGILLFAVENHKFIGEIIKKKEKGEFDAVAKMKVMYAQKKAQEARRKMSDKKKKRITIKYLVNGKNREFIGREDMAKELGVSLATVKKMLSDEKYCISKGFKVIDRQ